jgi:VWFA-related protein
LRTSSNLVVVDVVVSEHDQPVLGLDRSAFHVFEDGKEQPLSSFDEHQPAATPPVVTRSALPPNTYSNQPVWPNSSAVNVLLLDALNTPLSDQANMRQRMIHYLGTIKPGTAMAVFTLSSQLRMVTDFTTDPAALVAALKNSKANPQQSATLASEQSEENAAWLAQVQGNAQLALQRFLADHAASETDARTKVTLAAMQELAGYLRGVPGRKNVIWFSGSFPLAILPDSMLSPGFQNVTNYREQIQQTSEMLTTARVAFYPVDARGLAEPPEFNAAQAGPGSNQPPWKEGQQRNSEQSAMLQVAEETGGRAFVDTNDFDKAVTAAVNDGSSYYTISYVPPSNHLDGQFHKIEVRLDYSRKLNLAYRRGYYAEKPDAPLAGQDSASKQFVAALAHDAPPATQILFEARVVPASDPLLKGVSIPSPAPGQMTLKGTPHRYVIDLTLDAHSLTFDPKPDGSHQAALELAVVGYDAIGQPVNLYQHPFQLGLKDALMQRVMTSGIPLRLAFDLPAGQIYLRIGIHDLNANRAGSLEVPLQVSAQ